MPRYSNLKLKPQVQADVVVFKAKGSVLTQEQKALNNLNAMLKQNVINPELNEVLTKEVNSKNKNVVKYLSNINLEKDENLKGHKAVAQRLVDNHSQISGAIASLKNVDDKTKEKLDFENQQKMVHGINEIYTKDKDVEKTEVTNGEIGFGGRKEQAKKIVWEHVAIAAGGGAITSTAAMPIAEKAGETLVPQLANMILQSAASLGVSSAGKVVPILGGILCGGIASAATAALGKAVIETFEALT